MPVQACSRERFGGDGSKYRDCSLIAVDGNQLIRPPPPCSLRPKSTLTAVLPLAVCRQQAESWVAGFRCLITPEVPSPSMENE